MFDEGGNGSGNDNGQSGGGMFAKRNNTTQSSNPTIKPNTAFIPNGLFRVPPSAPVQQIVMACANILKKW